jgi:Na+/H+ antiporter NhaD/arsenite permease-like protein
VLSACLDNAPTYLNFFQIAAAPHELKPAAIGQYLSTHDGMLHLRAISTGAVFFGGMTYIGNGPNFMVQAIADAAGVKTPSFFGYIGWALLILLPVLAVHWAVLIR